MTRERLSKTPARQCAKTLERLNGLPWHIVLILAATRQHRASLPPENATTFHHGKGDGIGHPWTNLVLSLGDRLSPLRPMPFDRKRYGQAHGLAYHRDHARVVASLRARALEDSRGADDRRAVLGLAESGDDAQKIDTAMADKGWHCMIALSQPRSVTSDAL